MYQKLLNKEKKLAVIGLGYVGLPIALEFAKKIPVLGFDISAERVALMKQGIDPSQELEPEAFEGRDIEFTADPGDLSGADFYIVAVPTPVDEHNVPNLRPLLSATEFVANVLKEGDYVVYESTVYPGCTEEECVPLLEKISGLRMGPDFKVGFSPERINPGDREHTLSRIIKVVSGNDGEALENISKVYEIVVDAGVHRASSIKVAEAAKIIENTQRDLNIALMNELSIIFDRLGINTYEVLEAAGTKWNFLNFYPGLVGGHCIGVDPYYLTYKANELGYEPEVILSGRRINDEMAAYIAKKTVQRMIANDKSLKGGRVLVMGITFKENVSDIRNSKVAELVKELQNFSLTVDVVDPCAEKEEVRAEYGLELLDEPSGPYDAIVVAVNHKEYLKLGEEDLLALANGKSVVVDVKGILKDKIKNMDYWSL